MVIKERNRRSINCGNRFIVMSSAGIATALLFALTCAIFTGARARFVCC